MHLRLIVSLASFGSVVDEVGNKEKPKGQSLSDFDVEPLLVMKAVQQQTHWTTGLTAAFSEKRAASLITRKPTTTINSV